MRAKHIYVLLKFVKDFALRGILEPSYVHSIPCLLIIDQDRRQAQARQAPAADGFTLAKLLLM